jgi:hypothetical protein
MEIIDSFLYVALEHYGLEIILIVEPTNPTHISSYSDGEATICDFKIYNNHAYLAERILGIEIILYDIKNPKEIKQLNLSRFSIYEFDIVDNKLHICLGLKGYQIYNIISPAKPKLLFSHNPPASQSVAQFIWQSLIIHKEEAIILKSKGEKYYFDIYDISDVSDPQKINSHVITDDIMGGTPTSIKKFDEGFIGLYERGFDLYKWNPDYKKIITFL